MYKYPETQQRLLSPSLKDVKKAVTDIRERIEIVHTGEFAQFLKHLFPCLRDLLTARIPPQFQDNDEHSIRHTVLEIFNRFPTNEILKQYMVDLAVVALEVIEQDNEENALIATRILFDLHRTYRPHLEAQVQPFLDLAQTLYRNVPNMIALTFSDNPSRVQLSHTHAPPPSPSVSASSSMAEVKSQTEPLPVASSATAAATNASSTSLAAQAPAQSVTSASSTEPPEMQRFSSVISEAPSETFDSTLAPDSGLSAPPPRPVDGSASSGFTPAMQSFRVLTECPLNVMLVFQLYPKFIQANIPKMVPLMMNMLAQHIPPDIAARHKQRYKEMIGCQVKTLSFLTYLLRGFAELMRRYEESISKSVLSLLRSCPPESVSVRKELLVATRHILATEFRKGFYSEVDVLLDENLLLGRGRKAHELLRPLAYSTLADLVHHVRDNLTTQQVSRVVYIFSRNIHDPVLPTTIQTTSVRLLLNLVDRLYRNQEQDPHKGRNLLVQILDTLVHKFGTLQLQIPRVDEVEEQLILEALDLEAGASVSFDAMVKDIKQRATRTYASLAGQGQTPPQESDSENQETSAAAAGAGTAGQKRSREEPSIQADNPSFLPLPSTKEREISGWIVSLFRGPLPHADLIHDVKQLIKTMMWGLKSVIYYLTNYRRQTAQPDASGGFDTGISSNYKFPLGDFEVELLRRFFRWGMACSKLFLRSRAPVSKLRTPGGAMSPLSPTSDQEAKDVLDHFAAAITVIDPNLIRSVIGPNMKLLFDYTVTDQLFMTVPQQLLANSHVSACTADILLTYLMSEMQQLSHPAANLQQPLATTPTPSVQKEQPGDASSKVASATAATAAQQRSQRSSNMLRLFRLVLGSISLFPDTNERVLRPRLPMLLLSCLRFAHESRMSINYCYVLKHTFRAISSGKFEKSYDQLAPYLPAALNGLTRLLGRTEHESLRNYLLELCLIFPARLSTLLPHLPLMMQILSQALRAEAELPATALRTLEFWLENLKPQYLYSVMTSQPGLVQDVLGGVCSHIRPAPYPYGMLALRLLGKLGGRNRQFLRTYFPHVDGEQCSQEVPKTVELVSSWNTTVRPSSDGESAEEQAMDTENPEHLDIHRSVLAACSILESLTTKTPVEAEIPSLISSYPDMHDGFLMAERPPAIPTGLRDFFEPALDEQAAAATTSKPTAGTNTGSGAVSDDQAPYAEQLRQSLQEEVKYIVMSTFLDHKKSALETAILAVFSLLGIDQLQMHDDPSRPSSQGDSPTSSPAPVRVAMQKAQMRHQQCVEQLQAMQSASEPDRAAMTALAQHGEADAALELLRTCIKAIIVASADPLLKDRCRAVLRALAFHFAMLVEAYATDDHSLDATSDENGFAQTAEEICFVLNQAVVECFEDVRPAVYKAAMWALKEALTARELLHRNLSGQQEQPPQPALRRNKSRDMERISLTSQDALVRDLLHRVVRACEGDSFVTNMAAIRVIHELCVLLARKWCATDEAVVVAGLLTVVKHFGREYVVVGAEDVFATLRKLAVSCHAENSKPADDGKGAEDSKGDAILVPTSQPSSSTPSEQLLTLLARHLSHHSTLVRLAVKMYLRHLAKLCASDVSELLMPYEPAVRQHILQRFNLPSPENQIGCLAGLSYCVSLQSPLIQVDAVVLDILHRSLKLLDTMELPEDLLRGVRSTVKDPSGDDNGFDENFNLLVSCFPLSVPRSVEFHLATLRLAQAVHTHGGDHLTQESDKIKALRTDMFTVLLRSLTCPWDEISVVSHRALMMSMSRPITASRADRPIPKDVVQDCLKPVFSNIQDARRLNVPLLRGLEMILKLLTNKYYVQLGGRILEHLKHWFDPEKIMKMETWPPGEEQRVAAAMLNLFHLLPFNSITSSVASSSSSASSASGAASGSQHLQQQPQQPQHQQQQQQQQQQSGRSHPGEDVRKTSVKDVIDQFIATAVKLQSVRHRFRQPTSIQSPYIPPVGRFLSKFPYDCLNFIFEPRTLCSSAVMHLLLETLGDDSASVFRSLLLGTEGCTMFINTVLAPVCGHRRATPELAVPADNLEDAQARLQNQARQTVQILTQGQGKRELGGQDPAAIGSSHAPKRTRVDDGSDASVSGTTTPTVQGSVSGFVNTDISSASSAAPSLHDHQSFDPVRLPAANYQSPYTSETLLNGVRLLRKMCELDPLLLANHPQLLVYARTLWQQMLQSRMQDEYAALQTSSHGLIYRFHQELEMLCDCLLTYCRHKPEDSDILFELVPILDANLTVDFTFLTDFLRFELPATFSAANKHRLLRSALAVLGAQQPQHVKVLLLREIVTPMLLQTFRDPAAQKHDVVNEDVVRLLMHNTLTSQAPLVTFAGGMSGLSDELRVELLKLATLLMQFVPDLLVEHRKELIKFAWNHLKADDSVSKHWAYVHVCRFIAMYDTPPKIILQVYVALLRTYQPEHRELVRMALDALIPALPHRLPTAEFVKAMKWTRKIMVEESHALLQLVHMWHVIVRHAQLFYPYRSHFVPQMVNSLARLGLPPNCPLQHRQLAVAIADTIIAWEWYRQQRVRLRGDMQDRLKDGSGSSSETAMEMGEEAPRDGDTTDQPPASKRQREAASSDSSSAAGKSGSSQNRDDDTFVLHPSNVEMLANFLIRLGLFAADNKQPTLWSLSARCVQLFRKLVTLVPMADVKLAYFEKLSQSALENYGTYLKQQSPQGTAPVAQSSGTGPVTPAAGAPAAAAGAGRYPSSAAGAAAPMPTAPGGAATAGNAGATGANAAVGAGTASVGQPVARTAQQAPHATAGRAGARGQSGLSTKILVAFLDLFTACLECSDGPSPFLIRNLPKLRDMMLPFFASEDLLVQSKLRAFLAKFVEHFPPSNPPARVVETGFYQKLKDLVDRRIRAAITEKVESKRDGSRSTGQGPSLQATLSAAGGKVSIGLSTIWLLDDICAQQPAYVDNHGAGLVKLAQKRAHENVSAAVQATRTGQLAIALSLQEHGQEVDTSKSLATSDMAMLNEAGAGSAGSVGLLDEALAVLVMTLRLLCRGIDGGFLKEYRAEIVQLITESLENSDCIPYLVTILTHVREWVLPDDNNGSDTQLDVLSPVERADLLDLMIDTDRLPEVASQPYVLRVLKLVQDAALLPPITRYTWTKRCSAIARSVAVGMMSVSPTIRQASMERALSNVGGSVVERLKAILQLNMQPVNTRFWMVLLVQILADALECTGLQPAKQATRLNVPGMTTSMEPDGNVDDGSLVAVVDARHAFVTVIRQLQSDQCPTVLSHLLKLAYVHPAVAEDLWRSLLDRLWTELPASDRSELTSTFIQATTRDCYKQVLNWPNYLSSRRSSRSLVAQAQPGTPLNTIQPIFQSLLHLTQPPTLPSEYIGAIAAMYSAWADGISALEARVLQPGDDDTAHPVAVLGHLLKDIGLQDCSSALQRRIAATQWTPLIQSLRTYGFFDDVQQFAYDAVRLASQEPAETDSLPSIEVTGWEQSWVDAAKQLGQWKVLQNYAQRINAPSLCAEAASVNCEWPLLQQSRVMPSVVAQLESGNPYHKLYDIMLAIVDSKYQEADGLCAQSVHMALLKWQQLPMLAPDQQAHHDLLHLSQRVYELRESASMMIEVVKANREARALPDLKGVVQSWRDRLPNRWDSLQDWDMLLSWRLHVYQMIVRIFDTVRDPDKLALLHDTPWTVVQLAKSARKHNLPDVTAAVLSKLSSTTMDVKDAFSKLREQIMVCSMSPSQLRGGLHMINQTNLEYFEPDEKAELFRLKALFQERLGLPNDAQQSFSLSVQISPTYGKSWLSWGHSYSQILEQAQASTTLNLQQRVDIAASVCVCFLKAATRDSEPARMLLSKVLLCLSTFDDANYPVGRQVQLFGAALPSWVWIQFLPYMVTEVARTGDPTLMALLQRVCVEYPQAIYYHLQDSGQQRHRPTLKDAQGNVFDPCENLRQAIHEHHPALFETLNRVTQALQEGLTPHPSEEFVTAMQSMIQAIVRDVGIRLNRPISETTLDVEALTASCKLPDLAGVRSERERKMWEAFMSDFGISEADAESPSTAVQQKLVSLSGADMLTLLQKWYTVLGAHFTVEADSSTSSWRQGLALVDSHFDVDPMPGSSHPSAHNDHAHSSVFPAPSPQHTQQAGTLAEIPGLYRNGPIAPNTDQHSRLVRFSRDVKVVRRSGAIRRRIVMLSSHGKRHVFIAQDPLGQSDHRTALTQLSDMFDWTLRQHIASRQRDLFMYTPSATPVQPRLYLLEDDPDVVSLEEISAQKLRTQALNSVDVMVENRLAAEPSLTSARGSPEKIRDVLKENFARMASDHSDDFLRKCVSSSHRTAESFYTFQRVFASQLGVVSALQIALHMDPAAPSALRFNRLTGHIAMFEAIAMVPQSGVLESPVDKADGVPMRLTRNMQAVLSPLLIHGNLAVAMGVTFGAIAENADVAQPSTALFMREYLVPATTAPGSDPKQLLTLANQNSKQTVELARRLAPAAVFKRTLGSEAAAQVQPSSIDRLTADLPAPIDAQIHDLIAAAMDADRQATMPLSWLGWM